MKAVLRFLALIVAVIAMMTGWGLADDSHGTNPVFPPVGVAEAAPPSAIAIRSETRFTGADLSTCAKWNVCGTDLGIPFTLENGSVGYLFGDTFTIANPAEQVGLDGWRSPVLLRSNQTPVPGQPLTFDSAAGVSGDGMAPDIMPNGHQSGGEYSVIPSDGISFPETGNEIVAYQSIKGWWPTDDQTWSNTYAGLAWSPDGNQFYRLPNMPTWQDNADNSDPFQTMSMQRDGDLVYIISVRAGRQPQPDAPMMLQRVPWNDMSDNSAYQCWTGNGWGQDWNGTSWGQDCQPLLTGSFGEPSLRKLSDGTWVMSYLNASSPDSPWIVTRTAPAPTGPWSPEKVQLTWDQNPFLYGGFIHPWSTKDNLLLMVSTWIPDKRYDVSVLRTSA